MALVHARAANLWPAAAVAAASPGKELRGAKSSAPPAAAAAIFFHGRCGIVEARYSSERGVGDVAATESGEFWGDRCRDIGNAGGISGREGWLTIPGLVLLGLGILARSMLF